MMLRMVEYKWLVAAAFVAGMFMDIMDTTIVNVAVPTLGQNFGVGVRVRERERDLVVLPARLASADHEQLLAGEWHSVIHPEDQARYVSETIAGQRSGAAPRREERR